MNEDLRAETVTITGSGKGDPGWSALSDDSVHIDHPVHAMADRTLNVYFLKPALGPGARVALELDAGSARRLASAGIEALAVVPTELILSS
jgi:hypothetical protein